MPIDLLKAFFVGVCAAAPLGPVMLLVLQKTICHGQLTGFLAGAGSAVIDALFAAASFFAISMIQEFVVANECWIMLAGGVIIILVGYFMWKRKSIDGVDTDSSVRTGAGYAIQAAGCALANPGAFALMLALVALWGLDVSVSVAPVWMLVLMVFAGGVTWWLLFTWAVAKLRGRVKEGTLLRLSRIAGVVVVALGIVLIVKGIMSL